MVTKLRRRSWNQNPDGPATLQEGRRAVRAQWDWAQLLRRTFAVDVGAGGAAAVVQSRVKPEASQLVSVTLERTDRSTFAAWTIAALMLLTVLTVVPPEMLVTDTLRLVVPSDTPIW